MDHSIERLVGQIDPARVHQLALELVRIPSPTGNSREIAEFYAERLCEVGLSVELDREFPDSPSVIAYLAGERPGPTLELFGHLDTVSLPHDPPVIRNGILYGRGACDQKGSFAAATEAARVLAQVRERLCGRLMICAYTLHEGPVGHAESLVRLLERKIVGDAVINIEGPSDEVPVIGKGMTIYEIIIERQGGPVHELEAAKELPNPLLIGLEVANALRTWADELHQGTSLPFVGPESLFIGQLESGDLYNTVAERCRIIGTRRYSPEKRLAEVEAEFQARLAPIRERSPANIRLNLVTGRDGFRLDEDEPLVRLLQRSYQEVTGLPLPTTGIQYVGDVSIFVHQAGVPAVYHGPGVESAHGNPEYVALSQLERLCRVLLVTAAHYLGLDSTD